MDTVRLGKFNPEGHPRPVLITLNRSSDVASILSKRAQVKSPYVINLTFIVKLELLNLTY